MPILHKSPTLNKYSAFFSCSVLIGRCWQKGTQKPIHPMNIKRDLKMLRLKFISSVFILFFSLPVFADISIASWNIQNLGWNNGKNFQKLAHIGGNFDLLAVQEIMSEEGAEQLHLALESATGEEWGYLLSHLIGRGSYREAYGFFWRESVVEYVDGAVVFLDSSDVFAREPMSARFRSRLSDQVFAIGNIHVLYGSRVQDRLPEIEALADYWGWLGEIYPDTPRLLVGDFNLESNHGAFSKLLERGAVVAVYDGNGTTISTIDGRYPNHYDHIFKEPGAFNISSRGIMRFPDKLGMTHERARGVVSDHVPVWIALGHATPPRLEALDTGGTLNSAEANIESQSCIDLNGTSSVELERLPHIGEARAEAIVQGRPWSNAQSLVDVRGLGALRVQEIIDSGLLCNPAE